MTKRSAPIPTCQNREGKWWYGSLADMVAYNGDDDDTMQPKRDVESVSVSGNIRDQPNRTWEKGIGEQGYLTVMRTHTVS